jgi:hypothetical protein
MTTRNTRTRTRNTTRITLSPRDRVYDFILRSGAAGVTDEDIYVGLSQSLTERADRHRREALAREGLIVKTGSRITSKNRSAAVWKAARVVKKVSHHR